MSKLMTVTKEGLDRMIMQSELRDVYHGVIVNGFQVLFSPLARKKKKNILNKVTWEVNVKTGSKKAVKKIFYFNDDDDADDDDTVK